MGPCGKCAFGFLHLFLLLIFLSIGVIGERRKHTVKTIKRDGDIFDCVHISFQPAFDHPLLRNHTIQMRPSSYPAGGDDESAPRTTNYSSIEVNSKGCPFGTIPIWRSPKDNLWIKSLTTFLNGYAYDAYDPGSSNLYFKEHWAIMSVKGRSYGAKAFINVYEPELKEVDQSSGATIDISFERKGQRIFFLAGWFVLSFRGDDRHTRFYIAWYDSIQNKYCINLLCPGFVQVSRDVTLGGLLHPISSYNGDQYGIALLIFQDRQTGNWWLLYGKGKNPVGYWPSSLFASFGNEATRITWGGRGVSLPGRESPPMGSGHFPYEGFGKSAFVRDIFVVNHENKLVLPSRKSCVPVYSKYKCYRVSDTIYYNDDGVCFYFGGPGGCK